MTILGSSEFCINMLLILVMHDLNSSLLFNYNAFLWHTVICIIPKIYCPFRKNISLTLVKNLILAFEF